jgi:rhodanese-related sulfurtransferase
LENKKTSRNRGKLAPRHDRGESGVVVDVREVDEFAAGHIPGAINMPLSTFQPASCRIRARCWCSTVWAASVRAWRWTAARQAAAVDTHLAGGFGAWQAAGLPVER